VLCAAANNTYVHTSPDFMRGYADLTTADASLLPEVGFE
jgi:hypothetical protein